MQNVQHRHTHSKLANLTWHHGRRGQIGHPRIQGNLFISVSFPVISSRLSLLCEGHGVTRDPLRPIRGVRVGESSSLSACFQSLGGTDGDLPLAMLCFQGCPARVAAGASRYPAHARSLSLRTETMTARADANTRSPPPPLTPPS